MAVLEVSISQWQHSPWSTNQLNLEARAELARRVEERDVVRADEGLRHADDGAGERGLAVVVRRVLRDVARELRDLDLVLDHRLAALEAREEDLALAGLEAVDHRRDRAHVVGLAELHEVRVDELRDRHVLLVRVDEGLGVEVSIQPLLAVARTVLTEGQVHGVSVSVALRTEPRTGFTGVVFRFPG